MWKALAVKELREAAGIAALALLADVLLLSAVTGGQLFPWEPYESFEIPFLGETFLTFLPMLAAGLALALGLRQTVGEGIRDTYLFLLQRPVSLRKLIGAKLGVGIGVQLLCTALPILGYGWWAATPGTHASPFEWSMTDWAWRVCLSLPMLYLAAFLSGLRPARWFGSRLMPVAAVGLALTVIIVLIPWWWLFGLAVVLLLDALLVATIFSVAAERDYP